jgi:hypothetical protein
MNQLAIFSREIVPVRSYVCVWQAGECVVSRDSGEAILAVDEKEELCRQTARRN